VPRTGISQVPRPGSARRRPRQRRAEGRRPPDQRRQRRQPSLHTPSRAEPTRRPRVQTGLHSSSQPLGLFSAGRDHPCPGPPPPQRLTHRAGRSSGGTSVSSPPVRTAPAPASPPRAARRSKSECSSRSGSPASIRRSERSKADLRAGTYNHARGALLARRASTPNRRSVLPLVAPERCMPAPAGVPSK
jgi:hypothetical protein